jgi:hypothetical protein
MGLKRPKELVIDLYELDMTMWYDWQPKPALALQLLTEICRPGEYRVLTSEEVPTGILSQELLAKTHTLLVISSGTPNRIYFMFNLNRIDGNEIDQMPYGIAFDGNETTPSGLLIQHAKYEGRTTPLPQDFREYILASGIYPLTEMPTQSRGPITELKIGSQERAFDLLVNKISLTFPE